MNNQIAIVDLNISNVKSVQNSLKHIGIFSEIITNPSQLSNNQNQIIILPGIGTFDEGMKSLKNLGWCEYLQEVKFNKSVKIIGLCLGMQLLFEGSEEGNCSGLGLLSGHILKFKASNSYSNYKIPHMGWTHVKVDSQSKINLNSLKNSSFYFVHSYYLPYDQIDAALIGVSNYIVDFCSIFIKDNIAGIQFHPEKSHTYGKNLLKELLSDFKL